MPRTSPGAATPAADERERMHALYRRGGEERQMAPRIVYPESTCPHPGCDQPMQAIDFRLEDHGRSVHDPLVRAWWADAGFAGRCPRCRGWVHFTIRARRAVAEDEAARYLQLPDNWHENATIL